MKLQEMDDIWFYYDQGFPLMSAIICVMPRQRMLGETGDVL